MFPKKESAAFFKKKLMGHGLIIYNIFSFTLVYKSQITITKCSQDKSKQELESEYVL